jgi:NhaA family Na+:H+ antiporter
MANSTQFYRPLWNSHFFQNPNIILPQTSLSLINNFLMAFFFLMAGMEIKRELRSGELSSFKKAILPFGAALGGMTVPALIFVAFNLRTDFIQGWGIPTATDIAFSVGIASLLGKRIPVGLKILLLALAIIDDLGAIIIIALFYGGHVDWISLGIGDIIYFCLYAVNYTKRFKIKFGWVQIILSLGLWYAFFNSGIEASISGVLVAFITPIDTLPKIERAIHGYVNFLILPLFALANTAILLPSHILGSLSTTIGLGIIFGLVIGKPVGIFLFSRILVALKIAGLPSNVKWKQLFGMGTLAGIGFTMSIFTTMLAFKSEGFQDIAKVAILSSVLLSLIFSLAYFMIISLNMRIEHEHVREVIKEHKAESGLEFDLG